MFWGLKDPYVVACQSLFLLEQGNLGSETRRCSTLEACAVQLIDSDSLAFFLIKFLVEDFWSAQIAIEQPLF